MKLNGPTTIQAMPKMVATPTEAPPPVISRPASMPATPMVKNAPAPQQPYRTAAMRQNIRNRFLNARTGAYD